MKCRWRGRPKKARFRRLSGAAKRVNDVSMGALSGLEAAAAASGDNSVDELKYVVVEERGALYGGLQRCSEAVKGAMYVASVSPSGKRRNGVADILWRLPPPSEPQNPMHVRRTHAVAAWTKQAYRF